MTSVWSLEQPTEPGLYLFYGEVGGYVPAKFALVEVCVGSSFAVGDQFMEPAKMVGAWRPFDEKPPDRAALVPKPPPEPVSAEAMSALIRWRVNGMDQCMNHAPHECFGKTLAGLATRFGPGQVLEQSVPEKHRPAAAYFHSLTSDEQYEVVAKELRYDPADSSPY